MEYYEELVNDIRNYLKNQQSLIILIGTAGCGKTTLAMELLKKISNPKITRVCLDNIISMESGYNYDLELKNFYRELEIATARKSLEHGHNLMVDDTNISKEVRRLFLDLVKEFDDIQTIGVFFNLSARSCIERRTNDPLLAVRERYCEKADWSSIIEKQMSMLQRPSPEEGFDLIFEIDDSCCRKW